MRMVAILKNDDHPEYGEVSMPLPIKASEYSHCMELLSSLSIGDALNKDCKVEELTRAYHSYRLERNLWLSIPACPLTRRPCLPKATGKQQILEQ